MAPKWLLEGNKLEKRSRKLADDMSFLLDPSFWEERKIPAALSAEIADYAKADCHRRGIMSIFGKCPCIGGGLKNGHLCEILEIDSIDEARKLHGKLLGGKYAYGKSGMLGLERHAPYADFGDSDHLIVLLTFHGKADDCANKRLFEGLMKEHGASVKNMQLGDGGIPLYSVRGIDGETLAGLSEEGRLDGVLSIAKMGKVVLD